MGFIWISYRDVTWSDSLFRDDLEAPLTAIALSLGFTGQAWSLTIAYSLARLVYLILIEDGRRNDEGTFLYCEETFEVPGAYLKWAQERGHQVTTTKVYENEALQGSG